MLHQNRLRDIIQNFIYIPDSSKKDEKIVCRYPQYYATNALYENIKIAQKPLGDGKGGTYFGATGCGKSFTMLFLTDIGPVPLIRPALSAQKLPHYLKVN